MRECRPRDTVSKVSPRESTPSVHRPRQSCPSASQPLDAALDQPAVVVGPADAGPVRRASTPTLWDAGRPRPGRACSARFPPRARRARRRRGLRRARCSGSPTVSHDYLTGRRWYQSARRRTRRRRSRTSRWSSASPRCCRSTPAASASSPATTSSRRPTSACRSSASACSTGPATSASRCRSTAGSRSSYPVLDPQGLPLRLLPDADGAPVVRSSSRMPGRPRRCTRASGWPQVGRVPLLLLDSDIAENDRRPARGHRPALRRRPGAPDPAGDPARHRRRAGDPRVHRASPGARSPRCST